MNKIFMVKDWDEFIEELMKDIHFLQDKIDGNWTEDLKQNLKNQITVKIRNFYEIICFSDECQKLIKTYEKRGEEFLNEFHETMLMSAKTTINALYSVLDTINERSNNNQHVINKMQIIFQKRKKDLDETLLDFTGQMIRYMLLWDCEDAGYLFYQFTTEGDSCERCNELNGHTFNVKNAKSGINLAPMHPHCDCGAVITDENGNKILMIGGREAYLLNKEKFNGIFIKMPENINDALSQLYWAKVMLYKKLGVNSHNQFIKTSQPEEIEDKYVLSLDDYKLVKVYMQLYHYFNSFGDIAKRDAVRLAIVRLRQKKEYRYKYAQIDPNGVYWTYDYIFFDKDCQVLFWEKN